MEQEQHVEFNLSFEFFVSSSARVPVNVMDNLPVIGEVPGGKITCLSSWSDGSDYFVHVGTSEGAVLLYNVAKKKTQNNTDFFESTLGGKRMLAKTKKDSVTQLECIQEGCTVVGLTSAGEVQVMSATGLDIEETIQIKQKVDRLVTEKGSPLRGVGCVSKNRISIFMHRQGEYKLEKEIGLKDVPLELEWTKGKLFVAYKTRYVLVFLDADGGDEQLIDEIPLANQKFPPAITLAGDQLLLRQGKQGFFFTFSGKKTGKKLDWSNVPYAVGYRRPFAVSLQDESIEVHNCNEEAMVQLIRNTQGLNRVSDGALLLSASDRLVFCLNPRSWESQIGQLLKAQRIDEALNLFKLSVPKSIAARERDQMLKDIHKAAGVVLFSNLKFSAAVSYLKDSDLDVRELIAFFPGYLPKDSRWRCPHRLTLEFLITETLLKRTKSDKVDAARLATYTRTAQEAVLDILLHRREVEGPVEATKGALFDIRKALDTAVIKLMVEMGSDKLADFLNAPNIPLLADDKDVIQYLEECGNTHALAVYYKVKGDHTKALAMLRELGTQKQPKQQTAAAAAAPTPQRKPDRKLGKKGKDDEAEFSISGPSGFRKAEANSDGAAAAASTETGGSTDGIQDTVDMLSKSTDLKEIFQYSRWVLEQNLMAGVSIFTSTARREPLPVEEALGFLLQLRQGGAQAATKYLEHVVFTLQSHDEKFHTKLANLYLDVILPLIPESFGPKVKPPDPGSEPPPLGPSRKALLMLLEQSRWFGAQQILQRIEGTVLFEERILCFTRLQRHEEALNVIYLNLKSYNKATAYCLKWQGEADTNLFLVLLKVYLKRVRGGEIPRAVESLLNEYPQYLFPNEVIPLLPPSIQIAQMAPYLESSLRHNQHRKCMGQVEKQLRRAEYFETRIQYQKDTSRSMELDVGTSCAVCHGIIGEQTMFVWYPNDVVCHFKCQKSKSICPVSGKDFGKE